MANTVSLNDFSGGLALQDSLSIDDNQLVVAKNMFYNEQGRLQTRRGISILGNGVPDSSQLISDCESVQPWSKSGDTDKIALNTSDQKSGSGCIEFDAGSYSTGANTISYTGTSTVDISGTKGYLGFWSKFPSGVTTDLDSVVFRLGSDASNYYEWTISDPQESLLPAVYQFVSVDFSDATVVGSPDDTQIDFFRLTMNTLPGYPGYDGILIDDIYCYSETTTKPISSIYGFKRDDTNERLLICVSGSNMFNFGEYSQRWSILKSGLTEFETETGRTNERTRWDFAVYKNVLYMVNGHDGLIDWDGTHVVETPDVEGRYIEWIGNRMYIAGDDDNPSTLSYTDASPADARTFGNSIVVGGEERGKINGIFNLGDVVLAFKNEKVYGIDVVNSIAEEIDSQSGGYSNRSIKNVENSILFFTDRGIDNLKAREGVTGAAALASESISKNVKSLTDLIPRKQYNASAGWYSKLLTNYYFMFDTGEDGGDNVPDTTLVLSSLLGDSWTQYILPAAYGFAEYFDSNGNVQYLMASANSGIVYKIEDGFDDNGLEIECEIKTKEFDFGDISRSKSFETLDIVGLKSEGKNIDVEVVVDGEVIASGSITDDNLTSSSSAVTLGSSAIGTKEIGGGTEGAAGDIELFPYLARMALPLTQGRTLQVRLTSNEKAFQWTLDHLRVTYESLAEAVFDLTKFI